MVAAVIGDVVYTFAKGFNSVYILSHFVENFNSIVYLNVSFICLLPDYHKIALTDIVFSYAAACQPSRIATHRNHIDPRIKSVIGWHLHNIQYTRRSGGIVLIFLPGIGLKDLVSFLLCTPPAYE